MTPSAGGGIGGAGSGWDSDFPNLKTQPQDAKVPQQTKKDDDFFNSLAGGGNTNTQ